MLDKFLDVLLNCSVLEDTALAVEVAAPALQEGVPEQEEAQLLRRNVVNLPGDLILVVDDKINSVVLIIRIRIEEEVILVEGLVDVVAVEKHTVLEVLRVDLLAGLRVKWSATLAQAAHLLADLLVRLVLRPALRLDFGAKALVVIETPREIRHPNAVAQRPSLLSQFF